MWSEAAHPRGKAGTSSGGEFVAASSSSSKSSSSRLRKGRAGRASSGGGALAYDPKRGTGPGYGMPGGDPRVTALQKQLTKLGLKDASGKPLAIDGKLGPKTTQAIKAAQKRLGLPADGRVTPALAKKLAGAKPRTQTSRLRKTRSGPRKKK